MHLVSVPRLGRDSPPRTSGRLPSLLSLFFLLALALGACGGAPAETARSGSTPPSGPIAASTEIVTAVAGSAHGAPTPSTAPASTQTTTGAAGERPEILRVGLIPNQSPDEVEAQYEPFRAYLAERLGQPVELFVATDYAGVVEAMASDRLDVAYFGGVTYVQAERRAKIRPIVTEVDRITGTTKYHSVIITAADSAIKRTADIEGEQFAFGDINSTSGSLYPSLMLEAAGVTGWMDRQNPLFTYTGGHDATAAAVQNGSVGAGGLEERILRCLIENGTVDECKIRIVERSAPIEGYPWVVRDALDPALVQRIADAYLAIEDAELLELLRAERYERVEASDYDYIREQAERVGLLRQTE